MGHLRNKLLATAAAVPMAFGAAAAVTALDWTGATVVGPAKAADNPCAADAPCKSEKAARNPCAGENPCAADKAACSPCAACNPCKAEAACNPCAAENAACSPCAACNPCAAEWTACNPCAACNPCKVEAACNPCAAEQTACNPCAASDPCKAAAACNPCAAVNPCAGANPCVAVIPTVDSTMPVDEILAALKAPPKRSVGKIYSPDEIASNFALRDLFQSVEVKSLGFDFNSSEVEGPQAEYLGNIAAAIKMILSERPHEIFFIEGHADAVGTEEYNLRLSKQRARQIKQALIDIFGIPEKSLIAGGFGEAYLKIDTEEREPQNRRVTVRCVTPLVKPAAATD